MQPEQNIILAIDPGTKKSGIVILKNGELVRCDNLNPEKLFSLIDELTLFNRTENYFLTIVYEDIRPYTSRFNMATINTCKMIGKLEHILNERKERFKAITRNEVKSFVFNRYNGLVVLDIWKKIAKKEKVTKKGNLYKPSFQYVDDRIVKNAMKEHWDIPTPTPGRKSKFGLSEHSWQALGVLTCYLHQLEMAEAGVF